MKIIDPKDELLPEARIYELQAGNSVVKITNYGATILAWEHTHAGKTEDVVLGLPKVSDYMQDSSCFGALVGPVANRTDKAEAPIHDVVYQLPKNDGPDQQNNLHSSATEGCHRRLWKLLDFVEEEAETQLILGLELQDGELGLPGNRKIQAEYKLSASDELSLAIYAESDTDTYLNLTSHVYFNLDGHASGNCLDHLVKIEAESYLPLRADSVSQGDIVSVSGTPFDFSSPKTLAKDIQLENEQLNYAKGYDHCMVVKGEATETPRLALSATGAKTGRSLEIYITAPGAHLYTGNWIDVASAKDGASYTERQGFAFEPEIFPDAIHHSDWPSPIFGPQRPFSSHILWKLA